MIDVEHLLATGGIVLLAAMVFAESGLLVGLFLPGDSLLFIAGFLSSNAGGNIFPPLPIIVAVAFLAAAAGDQVGYVFGRRIGPSLSRRPQRRVFSPEHLARAQVFFERRGPLAIVLARFVPVVRTFTPVVAGAARMRYRMFVIFNLLGAALWSAGVTTLGYFLGQVPVIEHNLDYAAIAVVSFSLIPIGIEYRRSHAARRSDK